ncbi:MAG: SDR family oxidoreductase [Rhodospirillaceae bacterium]|jgi:NAD(P)-dependent dehydrogenase (short-subunit alcohol dehydrogenase family)
MKKTNPKNVLITGGARRIGESIAKALAEDGWNIAIHCRHSKEEAEKLASELCKLNIQSIVIGADLNSDSDLAGLLPAAAATLGPITCLINNASLFELDTVESATYDSWDKHMKVNTRAPFFLSQALMAGLGEDQTGNIVNIIDQRVWNPTPWFISYAASKSVLWSLTQSLALAMAPRVRVNAIGPGPTLPSPRQSQEDFLKQEAGTPLKRGAPPSEIAEAIRFILSATSMTGQMIALDGGQHLGWEYPEDPKCPVE